jgi:NAD(P)-dependent dehydrogenase (short-subunit alcohol dehydrogenase family)
VKIAGLSVKGGSVAPALQGQFSLKDKGALMTGGSKGIVAGTARVLSDAGADALGMIEQRSGDSLDDSSWAGSIVLDDQGTSCGSRAGLNLLTRMIASVHNIHSVHIHSDAVEPKAIVTLTAEKNRSDLATCRSMLEKRTQHG